MSSRHRIRFWLRWNFTAQGARARRIYWAWGEGKGPLLLTRGQAMTLARRK